MALKTDFIAQNLHHSMYNVSSLATFQGISKSGNCFVHTSLTYYCCSLSLNGKISAELVCRGKNGQQTGKLYKWKDGREERHGQGVVGVYFGFAAATPAAWGKRASVGQIKYRKFSPWRMREWGTRQHRIIIAKKCAKDPTVWRIRTIWKGSEEGRGGWGGEAKHLPNVVAAFRCLWPNKFAHKATFIKHKQSHCLLWYVRAWLRVCECVCVDWTQNVYEHFSWPLSVVLCGPRPPIINIIHIYDADAKDLQPELESGTEPQWKPQWLLLSFPSPPSLSLAFSLGPAHCDPIRLLFWPRAKPSRAASRRLRGLRFFIIVNDLLLGS